MVIKKNGNSIFEAPSWLIALGIFGVASTVVGTARAICSCKAHK